MQTITTNAEFKSARGWYRERLADLCLVGTLFGLSGVALLVRHLA